MELKLEAVRLRQLGHTYKEISQLLNGAVSVDQCKRWLKGVNTPVTNDECVNELVELATRPQGVSVYEANGVIMKHNKDKQLTKDQMRYIRTKAKAKDSSCLFRQDWMSPTNPAKSYQAFCAYVLHIQDEIDNLARWYCDSFPDTKPSSVRYEILQYLKPSKDGMPLSKKIKQAEILCEEMEDRLSKVAP